MELSELRIFTAAARSGSFSAAAERLYISHSTVSRAVSALEDELGAPLFTRGSRGVALTPAGKTLLAGGEALLAQAAALARQIRDGG